MYRLAGLATLLLLTFPALGRTAPPPRLALVIGNGAYRSVEPLRNPDADARLMAATLRRLGFDLVGGGAQLDLDRAGMEAAIRRFHAAIRPGSIAFFYYSGHGVQLGGANYLVPVSAAPQTPRDVPVQMVAADLVLQDMADAGAALNVVVLDACRNNPFAGTAAAGGARGIRAGDAPGANTGAGLAEMHAPSGTLISFATQPGSVAFDGAVGAPDSPYTTALASALSQPGLEVVRAFNRAGIEVGRQTGRRQEPWLAISPLEDEVFLAGRDGVATPLAAAPENPVMAAERAAEPMAEPAASLDPGALPPPCPAAGLQATRDGRALVRYDGTAAGAPGFCVAEIAGAAQVQAAGIWPAAWPGAAMAAAALREVLAGPVGGSTSFRLSADVQGLRDTVSSESWRFTLTNDGPTVLPVAGAKRPALRLRWEERNLAHAYRGQADIVLDARTGVVLAQTYRVMAGGAAAAYDFWAAYGGGLGAVPDFRVTALN